VSRLERAALALGILLYIPALFSGRFADDVVHRAFAVGDAPYPGTGPLQVFLFRNGETKLDGAASWSILPWSASPDFEVRFFRPLSSVLHWLDVTLWPASSVLPHAVSLAVGVALVWVAIGLFRDLGAAGLGAPPLAVGLAALFYAGDDGHALPIGWVAGRNTALSGLCALLALRSWFRAWRAGGSGVPAAAWLALGLGFGEGAIAVCGFVIAGEFWPGAGAAGGVRQVGRSVEIGVRLRRIGAIAAVALGWLVFFATSGYGARGSSIYVSPIADPGVWASLLPSRLLLLLGAFVGSLPCELAELFPAAAVALLPASAVVVAVWALFVLPRARTPLGGFLLVGSLLSIVPFLGTFPSQRLLVFPSAALAFVTAMAVADGLAGTGWRKAGAWAGIAIYGVLGPLGVLGVTALVTSMSETFRRYVVEMDHPAAAEAEQARILTLSVADSMLSVYLPLLRHDTSLPEAGTWWAPSSGAVDQRMIRTGDRTFRLAAGEPGLVSEFWQRLPRDGSPLPTGTVRALGDLRVTVTDGEADRLLVREIEVETDVSLDDPRLWILAMKDDRLTRMLPPPIGNCTMIAAAAMAPPPNAQAAPPCPAVPRVAGIGGSAELADSALGGSAELAGSALGGSAELASLLAGSAELGCALEVSLDGATWQKRADVACPSPTTRLLVAGDPGFVSELLDSSVTAARAICSERGCDALVVPGDLVYGDGAEADAVWGGVVNRFARLSLPMLTVLGNHEYRHEPNPERKRAAVYGSDGKHGVIVPASSYAARVVLEGRPMLAVAGLDTDSVANPGPEMPGIGERALDAACAQGVPVVTFGHHPPSSQGGHHTHEAHVEAALRAILIARKAAGCRIVLSLAGHDHDLQAFPPSCEQPETPPIVVSGAVARGYRPAGPQHLPTCPDGRPTRYFADRPGTGLAWVAIDARGEVRAALYTIENGVPALLSEDTFAARSPP
jgi:hypothetical protein